MKIQSIERAIKILNLFNYSRPRWGIAEIALAMGLAKGTVHNIVSTLVDEGMLTQDIETRKYSLGSKLFFLGTIMVGTSEINQKAAGPIRQLAEKTGLICRLAIWDRDAALITIDIMPNNAASPGQRVGPRVIAYCSAIGRALLAYLEPAELKAYLDQTELIPFTPHTITNRDSLLEELVQTKTRGYAIDNQELPSGQASIASTIFKSGGQLCASISVTGTPDRIMGSGFEELVTKLKYTAEEISRYMDYFPSAL